MFGKYCTYSPGNQKVVRRSLFVGIQRSRLWLRFKLFWRVFKKSVQNLFYHPSHKGHRKTMFCWVREFSFVFSSWVYVYRIISTKRRISKVPWVFLKVYLETVVDNMALRQFGPKTNSDQKPDSDQRQIRTKFWNSAQIISLINLIA